MPWVGFSEITHFDVGNEPSFEDRIWGEIVNLCAALKEYDAQLRELKHRVNTLEGASK